MTPYSVEINSFKAALTQHQQQIGVWSSLCSSVVAEILSDAGFDWVLFDSEHSPIEISNLLPLIQATMRGETHPAVRVAWNDPVLIKRVLDIGAQTVFSPFIQNADQAAALVAACFYPPHGIRGVAGSTRASRFGRSSNYLKEANSQICIIAQVETLEATGNIEEIASVDGIDGLFVGPSDLSASMGFPGNVQHPDVQNQLKKTLHLIQAAGKPAGILATNGRDAQKYLDWGYTFVAAAVDVGLLVRAVDELATQMGKS